MENTSAPPRTHPEVAGGRVGSIAVLSPSDGREVGSVPVDGTVDVASVVRRLRAAQPEWEAAGPAERCRWLRRLRDWMLDHDHALAALLQTETGKPWAEANVEVPVGAALINYYTSRGRVRRALRERHVLPHGALMALKRLSVARHPYPVVGVFAPSNGPVATCLLDAVPALLAGAGVVVKPSEYAPLTIREILRGWHEDVGAPDVFAGVFGEVETGVALVDEVDYVQFTGSTATGAAIARQAAANLTPFSLELGGKDAMVVLADADLDRAAGAALWGGMFNAGQTCTSVERVYVEAPVYERFLAILTDRARGLRQGADGAGDDGFRFDVGAIAHPAQLEKVTRHVGEALALGARAVVGGTPADGPGLFYPPTILVDVDHSMECMREETFGPVIPVLPVADADEAVRLANASSYGLSATVWTRDRAKGERIARQLDVGAVNINDMFTNVFCVPTPHGGWKQSGVGTRLGGREALLKYCRSKTITRPRVAPKAELLWFPYSPRRGRLVGRMLRALTARGARRWRSSPRPARGGVTGG